MYDVRIEKLVALKVSSEKKIKLIDEKFSALEQVFKAKSEESKQHKGLEELPLFGEETLNQLARKLEMRRQLIDSIDQEIKECEDRQKLLKVKQHQYTRFVQGLVTEFKIDMEQYTSASLIKKQEMLRKQDREKHRAKYAAMVDKIFATAQKSRLYCNFYFPNYYEKEHGTEKTYAEFGFDWPKKNDLIDLCVEHEIPPNLLVLDRVMWKKDGCGFGMIQLGFNSNSNPIVSPQFCCKKHFEGEEKNQPAENFTTTYLRHDKGPLKQISVNVSEEKYFENIGLLTQHVAGQALKD